jgi:hypothetical protein
LLGLVGRDLQVCKTGQAAATVIFLALRLLRVVEVAVQLLGQAVMAPVAGVFLLVQVGVMVVLEGTAAATPAVLAQGGIPAQGVMVVLELQEMEVMEQVVQVAVAV